MTNNREQQMNALVMRAGGAPAQALAVRSEPVPVPGPGGGARRGTRAGVNPFDVVIAAGMLGSPLPMIPGIDFAGVVVSDGDLKGQEVWGSQAYLGWQRPGAHAQFVALPETWLSRKPERLTMTEAGAVGRPYIAAWQAVINMMDLEPGETILITGGAGLVGQAATAIAHWRGARPIVADRRKPEGAWTSSTPDRRTSARRHSSSPVGAVSTWCSTRSAARSSSPLSRAFVLAAG